MLLRLRSRVTVARLSATNLILLAVSRRRLSAAEDRLSPAQFGRGDGADQRVQATGTGVAATGTLYLVPEDFLGRVVDINQRHLVNTFERRRVGGGVS